MQLVKECKEEKGAKRQVKNRQKERSENAKWTTSEALWRRPQIPPARNDPLTRAVRAHVTCRQKAQRRRRGEGESSVFRFVGVRCPIKMCRRAQKKTTKKSANRSRLIFARAPVVIKMGACLVCTSKLFSKTANTAASNYSSNQRVVDELRSLSRPREQQPLKDVQRGFFLVFVRSSVYALKVGIRDGRFLRFQVYGRLPVREQRRRVLLSSFVGLSPGYTYYPPYESVFFFADTQCCGSPRIGVERGELKRVHQQARRRKTF